PQQIRYLDEHYTTLPFPFAELNPPQFEITAKWNLGQVLGFLDSWSATRRYEQTVGDHPAKRIWQALADAWGEPDREWLIRWPLYIRVGKRDLPNGMCEFSVSLTTSRRRKSACPQV